MKTFKVIEIIVRKIKAEDPFKAMRKASLDSSCPQSSLVSETITHECRHTVNALEDFPVLLKKYNPVAVIVREEQ